MRKFIVVLLSTIVFFSWNAVSAEDHVDEGVTFDFRITQEVNEQNVIDVSVKNIEKSLNLTESEKEKALTYDFMLLGLTREQWQYVKEEVNGNIILNDSKTSSAVKEEIVARIFEEAVKVGVVTDFPTVEGSEVLNSSSYNVMEYLVCLPRPNDCIYGQELADLAVLYTYRFYGVNGQHDDSDAFRHAYWNALMTYNIDVDFAEDIATAHEYNAPQPSKTMDLFNNQVGRDKAEIWISYYEPYTNLNKNKDLAYFISDMVRVGFTRKLNSNGQLIPTTVGETYIFPSSC